MRPLHALQQALPIFLLSATRASAEEDENYTPSLNYRPENISGLDYYYYPWKGSYYNGSLTFTISSLTPRPEFNYDDEPLCPQLSDNYTYSFSYPGILGVTQTEGGDERPENKNPFNVILSASRSNFTAHFSDYLDSGNMQVTDESWVFESVDVSRRAYGYETTKPNFNLTVTETDTAPFRALGTTEADNVGIPGFQMNMSSCTQSEAWWAAGFASQEQDVLNPALALAFDSHSANFRLEGFIIANTLGGDAEAEGGDDETLPVLGRVSVEFLGRHDDARSDLLGEGTPVRWIPTVGFGNNSLNLDYEGGGVKSMRMLGGVGLGWVLGLVLGAGYILL
ncbi:hypothetical protein BJX70DRAFT_357003 [Aspergillus crustosus]